MLILVTEKPSDNAYIESLLDAYKAAGHSVIGDVTNFFHSNVVPDVLHIHWPERLYDWYPHRGGDPKAWRNLIEARLRWYRENKTIIVHTVHNLQPHESRVADSTSVFSLVIAYADILVHHCRNSIQELTERFPAARHKQNIVCHHGDYLINFREIDRLEARRRLHLPEDGLIILNFGKQRPYKNEPFVISALRKMRYPDKCLLIAGEFVYPPAGTMRRALLRLKNRVRESLPRDSVRFIYKKFNEEEMASVLCAADLLFLGQHRALNSGILPLAATFARPAVYPDTGCFRESMEGWWGESFTPGDLQDAAEKLDRVCESLSRQDFQYPRNSAWLEKNSWKRHAGTILDCINNLPLPSSNGTNVA